MTHEVIKRPQARRDLITIADYIAEQAGFNASERFLKATEDTFRSLAFMPGIGSPRDYGNPSLVGMRMCPVRRFRKYLVFYLATDDHIEILRVLHGAQNIDAIFAPEDT